MEKKYAWLWLLVQILKSAPGLIFVKIGRSSAMFNNYMKIAFRNLKNHRVYSFINISGLAIGIACCLLIILYINFEMSYDNYHKDVDRIYRIGIDINTKSFKRTFVSVAFNVGPHLKDNFPQVELSGRIWPRQNRLVKVGENVFYENNFFHIDKEIFDIFSIFFLMGDLKSELSICVFHHRIAYSGDCRYEFYQPFN